MKTFAKLKCTQSPHRFVLRDQNLTLILKTGSCTLNLEWNMVCPPSQNIRIIKICINYIRSNNNTNNCENWFLFVLHTYFLIVFNFVSWSSKPKLVTLGLSAEKLHWPLPKKTSQHFQLLPPSLPAKVQGLWFHSSHSHDCDLSLQNLQVPCLPLFIYFNCLGKPTCIEPKHSFPKLE